MGILNRFAEFRHEIALWRHELHRHPELLYDLPHTANFIAEKLRGFGVDEVVTGIGRTGVVAVIGGRRRSSGKVIGLRADMDALPIQESGRPAYVSTSPGKMHACGHDGHMAMLLGAASHLAQTRNFDGTAVLIFQPAEEGGAGALAMVEDGLMDRFAIGEVFGMHNLPGMKLGQFGIRAGAIMAATDQFTIEINGRGGHAARPNDTVDPVIVGSAMVQALQTIVSRSTDPVKAAVVSVTQFHAGEVHNVIAETARLGGTVRSLEASVRQLAEARMREIVAGIAAAHGASFKLSYERGYPVTNNHPAQTEFAASVAASVVGASGVDEDIPPLMAGEDFAYMLNARPGAFVLIGNGDSAGLHNPAYDFNDEAIPFGCSYWVGLVESGMRLD